MRGSWYRVARFIPLLGLQGGVVLYSYPSMLSRFTVSLQSANLDYTNMEAIVITEESSQDVGNRGKLTRKKTRGARKRDLIQRLQARSPIVSAGLPKTGTTSIHNYFGSLGHGVSSHTGYAPGKRTGVCFEKNLKKSRPMLEGCGNFTVYSDIGYADFKKRCFYPFWHSKVEDFYKSYPNGTIILNVRNATDWARSIHNWGNLAVRWRKCKSNPLPVSKNLQDWINFYEEYNEHIRAFCRNHPSLSCIEFHTDDPSAGHVLEEAFGIPASKWKQCRPSGGGCKKVN